ncbi:hypothetical protein GN156_02875 [bacterium LRH843]|nr:hypothetical protein [bacterium LRH843]
MGELIVKKRIGWLLIIIMLVTASPYAVKASEHTYFYLDGQEQRYQGEVVEDQTGMWVPIRPILSNLGYVHSEWEMDSTAINQFLRGIRQKDKEAVENIEEFEFLQDLNVSQVNKRDMIHIDEVKQLGFDVFYYHSKKILHINTPRFMEIAGIVVGDRKGEVERLFPEVHWNTAFGQDADFIGFNGDMLPFSYKDRYGYERNEEVPELQVEIKDDHVSYVIVSSDRYPTSKKIKVGDRLTNVYRTYGTGYVRDRVDDKNIIVYDVEFGSIWFIANSDQEIERIAYWDHHLRGFGENQVEEVKEDSSRED